MNAAKLKIEGHEVNIANVWVHFKSLANPKAARFSLLVRGEYIVDVFDGHKFKPKDAPWEQYVLQNLRKMGASAFDYYLRVLKGIDSIETQVPLWVIISVDGVKLVDKGILLEGTAEEFHSTRTIELKPIQ